MRRTIVGISWRRSPIFATWPSLRSCVRLRPTEVLKRWGDMKYGFEAHVTSTLRSGESVHGSRHDITRACCGVLTSTSTVRSSTPTGAASVLWADPTVMARPQTHQAWGELVQRLTLSYFPRMVVQTGDHARGLVLRDRVFALGLCPFGSYAGLIVGSSSELGRIASVVRNATESAPRQATQSVLRSQSGVH